MTIRWAILICYRMLVYRESKLWSYDIFKCVNEISPVYLNAIFARKPSPYALRDSSILVRPKYGLKSFKSYGAKIWNILPRSYKGDISLKTNLKQWSNHLMARNVNVPFVTSTRNQVFIFASIHMYVCFLFTYVYIRMHLYMHIYVYVIYWDILGIHKPRVFLLL